jgi:flagellar basal body P-ring formation protein FlgA
MIRFVMPWLVLAASPLAALPAEQTQLRDAIAAFADLHGVQIEPVISANRPFPACGLPLDIAPVQSDDWASLRVTCGDPSGWQRVIRTTALPRHQPRVPGQGPVQQTVTAIVLTESLPRGTILQASHLGEAPVGAAGHSDLIQDIATATGRRLRSNLGAGQALLGRHLQPDTLVQRNRAVTIAMSAAPILIEAAGTALDDGQLGEVIRVRNASSARIMQVTVVGPNKVTVLPNTR